MIIAAVQCPTVLNLIFITEDEMDHYLNDDIVHGILLYISKLNKIRRRINNLSIVVPGTVYANYS